MAKQEGDKDLSKLKEAKNSTTNPAKEDTEAYGSEDDEFDPAKAPSEDVDDCAGEELSSSGPSEEEADAGNSREKLQTDEKRKHAPPDSKPRKKRKPSSKEDGSKESDSDPEIVRGLSGDEVDTANIVQGGRGARRGRAQQAAQQMQKYKQKAQDSDEDSW